MHQSDTTAHTARLEAVIDAQAALDGRCLSATSADLDRLDEARRAIADADADEGATAETLRRPFVLLASARLGGNAVRDVLRRWPEMSDDERRGAFDAMKVVCSDLNV